MKPQSVTKLTDSAARIKHLKSQKLSDLRNKANISFASIALVNEGPDNREQVPKQPRAREGNVKPIN